MSDENKLIQDMVNQVNKHLDDLDDLILSMQKQPNNLRLIDEIGQKFNVIQNTVSFYEFNNVALLASSAKELLTSLFSEKVGLAVEHVSSLLSSIDAIREMQEDIKKTGTEPVFIYADIVVNIKKLKENVSSLTKLDLTDEEIANLPDRKNSAKEEGEDNVSKEEVPPPQYPKAHDDLLNEEALLKEADLTDSLLEGNEKNDEYKTVNKENPDDKVLAPAPVFEKEAKQASNLPQNSEDSEVSEEELLTQAMMDEVCELMLEEEMPNSPTDVESLNDNLELDVDVNDETPDSFDELNESAINLKAHDEDPDTFDELNESAINSKANDEDPDTFDELNESAINIEANDEEPEPFDELDESAINLEVNDEDPEPFNEFNESAINIEANDEEPEPFDELDESAINLEANDEAPEPLNELNESAINSKAHDEEPEPFDEFTDIGGEVNDSDVEECSLPFEKNQADELKEALSMPKETLDNSSYPNELEDIKSFDDEQDLPLINDGLMAEEASKNTTGGGQTDELEDVLSALEVSQESSEEIFKTMSAMMHEESKKTIKKDLPKEDDVKYEAELTDVDDLLDMCESVTGIDTSTLLNDSMDNVENKALIDDDLPITPFEAVTDRNGKKNDVLGTTDPIKSVDNKPEQTFTAPLKEQINAHAIEDVIKSSNLLDSKQTNLLVGKLKQLIMKSIKASVKEVFETTYAEIFKESISNQPGKVAKNRLDADLEDNQPHLDTVMIMDESNITMKIVSRSLKKEYDLQLLKEDDLSELLKSNQKPEGIKLIIFEPNRQSLLLNDVMFFCLNVNVPMIIYTDTPEAYQALSVPVVSKSRRIGTERISSRDSINALKKAMEACMGS